MLEAIEGAGITVYRPLMQGEFIACDLGHHLGPEVPCRQVRVDVENLPLTGEPAQEGGHDKLRDTLATKASADKQVADVVLGAVDMRVVVHGHETGEFTVHLDQKWLGPRLAPVILVGSDVEKTVLAEFQR